VSGKAHSLRLEAYCDGHTLRSLGERVLKSTSHPKNTCASLLRASRQASCLQMSSTCCPQFHRTPLQ
jgi:hypothetical protein